MPANTPFNSFLGMKKSRKIFYKVGNCGLDETIFQTHSNLTQQWLLYWDINLGPGQLLNLTWVHCLRTIWFLTKWSSINVSFNIKMNQKEKRNEYLDIILVNQILSKSKLHVVFALDLSPLIFLIIILLEAHLTMSFYVWNSMQTNSKTHIRVSNHLICHHK